MYLHPSLRLGQHLQENTVDDSTKKMDGPVSDLMHTIEQVFSGPGNDGEEDIL
jgi:hypothetical protein